VNFYLTSAVNSSVFPAPIPVTGDQVRSVHLHMLSTALTPLAHADSFNFWF